MLRSAPQASRARLDWLWLTPKKALFPTSSPCMQLVKFGTSTPRYMYPTHLEAAQLDVPDFDGVVPAGADELPLLQPGQPAHCLLVPPQRLNPTV